MATRFTPSTLGSQTDAINTIADELHAMTGVGAATENATVTAVTMTAAQALAGVWENTAAGALALTLPTAANLVAAMPNAQVGSTFVLWIVNTGNNTITFTTNTGLTITLGHGTATLATALTQALMFKVTAITDGAETVDVWPLLKAGQ
jgi:hypothetical protein